MNHKRKINQHNNYSDYSDYDSDDTVENYYIFEDRREYKTSDVPSKFKKSIDYVKESHINMFSYGAYSNPEKSRRRSQYRQSKRYKKSRNNKNNSNENEDDVYSRKSNKCEFNRQKLKDIKNISDDKSKEDFALEI
jgi:hypothetical protein